MILLKQLLKKPWAKAVLGGLKPCIIGIILEVGVHMIMKNCIVRTGGFPVDLTAAAIVAGLALLYFGSRKILADGITVGSKKVLKKGISPIGLIVISAIVGILVYGV